MARIGRSGALSSCFRPRPRASIPGPMIEARALEEDPALTVGDYLTEWLSHTRARVRTTTYRGYEGLIRLYALPHLGQIALPALRPLHLQRLYGELVIPRGTLSGGTVLNLHLVLTQALGQ